MRDLNEMQYFAAVAEHGGYAAASRATGVPKSTLSRRIYALEQRLKTQLLHRGTRLFQLTDIGQAYWQHCQAMLIEAEAADAQIAQVQAEPAGLLRLSCPPALMSSEFADLIASFMAAYPKVSVQVEVSNRVVDVLREGIDVAIRVRFPPFPDSGEVTRSLAWSRQRLLVAPRWLAALSDDVAMTGQAVADRWQRMAIPSLHLGSGHEPAQWHVVADHGEALTLTHQPKLIANDMNTLMSAARAGVGAAALPEVIAGEAMRAGELVEVMPGWQPRAGLLHLAFAGRRGLLPAVRVFIEYCAQAFEVPARLARGYDAV